MKESEFHVKLFSQEKSFRLEAIEWALLQTKLAPKALEELKQRSEHEQDEECLLLIQHILKMEAPESEEEKTSRTEAIQNDQVDQVVQQYLGLATDRRLAWLSYLHREKSQKGVALAPAILPRETHPTLQAAIIRFFGNHWPTESIGLLVEKLRAEALSVRLAALSTLIESAPERLASELPNFLASDDSRFRFLGVRGLAKLDLEEAVAHLEDLLLQGKQDERHIALSTALIMPFESVQELLLKYLSLEKNEELLKTAGLPFQINPDPQIPYRLWEIAESSPKAKSAIIRELVQGAIGALTASKALEDDLEAYKEKLQTWIKERMAKRLVQSCLSRIQDDNAEEQDELITIARKKSEDPLVLAAFRAAGEMSLPPAAKTWLNRLLKELPALPAAEGKPGPGPTASPAAAPGPGKGKGASTTTPPSPITAGPATAAAPDRPEKPVPGPKTAANDRPANETPARASGGDTPQGGDKPRTFQELPEDEQIPLMASWDDEHQTIAEKELKGLFKKPDLSERARGAALRAATRLDIFGFEAEAQKALKSTNSSLLCAGIDYLGHRDFDLIQPYIGQFLKETDSRVKGTALKVLQKQDPMQAISSLLTMLKGNPKEQNAAINCLVYFDFALVRTGLCEVLGQNAESDLIPNCMLFFESNPDPENLYSLYRLEKSHSGPHLKILRETRLRVEQKLVQFGRLPKGKEKDREAELEARLKKEQQKQTAPPTPYSVKAIRQVKVAQAPKPVAPPPPTPAGTTMEEPPATSFFGVLMENIVLVGGVFGVGLVICVAIYLFSAPGSGGVLTTTFEVNKKARVKALVEGYDSISQMVKLKNLDGKTILISADTFPGYEKFMNRKIDLDIIPTQVTGAGTIMANLEKVPDASK